MTRYACYCVTIVIAIILLTNLADVTYEFNHGDAKLSNVFRVNLVCFEKTTAEASHPLI